MGERAMAGERTGQMAAQEEDKLVERLRKLHWPEVPAGLRERCWEDFVQRLEEREQSSEDSLAGDHGRRSQ